MYQHRDETFCPFHPVLFFVLFPKEVSGMII